MNSMDEIRTDRLFNLSGRVTLVTGGHRGLGKTMCQAVAECGSDVVINYPFEEEKSQAEDTAGHLSGLGVRVRIVKADVTRVREVEAMFEDAQVAFNRLDVLINNAGITSAPSRIHEMPVEDWDRVMAVNLRGPFLCMKTALPIMMKQNKGCIINVASVAALRATDSRFLSIADYSASKAGLVALTRQAAADYAQNGIRINAIALGFHGRTGLTAEWKKAWSDVTLMEYAKLSLQRTPMGRRGEEFEVKGLIAFLASEASSYITGQTIIQDGGISL